MSICEYLENLLTNEFSIANQRKENSISVSPQNQSGFEVALREDEDEITVSYEGWHEHFNDADSAINCFLFGLTNRYRLCVKSWGAKPWKWTLEYLDEDSWIQWGGSMHYLSFPRFWRSRETVYLQNNALGFKAIKELIWKNGLQVAGEACTRGELEEAKEILLSIQEEAKEYPSSEINEHIQKELMLLEIEDNLVQLFNYDTQKAIDEEALAETEEIAIKCADVTEVASSYVGMTAVIEPTGEGGVEYRVIMSKPESYHVVRTVIPEGDRDEWITIGNMHWRIPFGPMPDMREDELTETKSLLVNPFIHILRERKANRGYAYRFTDREFWVLVYNLDNLPDLIFFDQNTSASIDVEIWIDPGKNLIVRTGVFQKNVESHGERKIIQTFSGFDSDLKIDKPTDFLIEEIKPLKNEEYI